MSLAHNLNALMFDGFILGQRTQITRLNDDGRHVLVLNGQPYAWLEPGFDQEHVEELIYDYIRDREGQ